MSVAEPAAQSQYTLPDVHLRQVAQLVPFPAGAKIGQQGEACLQVGFISRGYVALWRSNGTQQGRIVAVLGPGDLLGHEALQPEGLWQVSVVALTPGAVYQLRADKLGQYCRAIPRLTPLLLEGMAHRLEMSVEHAALLTSDCARTRVIGLIELLTARLGSGDAAQVLSHLTQAQVGEMLGLARETVTRIMSDLRREGVLRRGSRRGLWLTVQPSTVMLAVMLTLRTMSAPAVWIPSEDGLELRPVRGRRGRTVMLMDPPRISLGAAGPPH